MNGRVMVEQAVWEWSPHEFIPAGGRCFLCDALPDRAIHDRRYAFNGGYGFIEAAHIAEGQP